MNTLPFHGPNAGYVAELYDRWLADPASVDSDTAAAFERGASGYSFDDRLPSGIVREDSATSPDLSVGTNEHPDLDSRLRSAVRTAELARAIREYGHLAAKIDPLGADPPGDPELDPATRGLRVSDLLALPANIVDGPLAHNARHALDAVMALRRVYSGTIGFDFDHVQQSNERHWLQEAVETGQFRIPLAPAEQRQLLERLTEVETFERFLHQRFVGQKRFSIEGTDMLIPILDEIVRLAAAAGAREIVMGMAHRGRLNVLTHVLGKPYDDVLAEFHHADAPETNVPWEGTDTGWQGDVKYHLGARTAYQTGSSDRIPITMAPNPSHLEFVNPVVEGMARAVQERRNQSGLPVQDETASLPIVMHGDAAFPGQGVVAETLNLSRLAGYRTGGTVHIIVNNQIGFTTETQDARSTLYSSDLAKGFEIPIVHVNADDPEACLTVARMAHAYRQEFRKDFLIDLVSYRRWGHNEGDEPAFTQPLLYERISGHPTVRQRWATELERLGVITVDETRSVVDKCWRLLEEAQTRSAERRVGEVNGFRPSGTPTPSSVSSADLQATNEALLILPDDFTVHPRLERILQRRREAISNGAIDWAQAEMLAFATILADGTPIRLTGQDTERGTFSQRHLTLWDAKTARRFTPLQALATARASFAVYNSPLSENAALGFEYGYSVSAPETLVLWEAQFGDFINSAQVIVDQFITSARSKWRQFPGLVLLLPHGYEGQGPEHSSARLERFIQMAASDNMRIANCTTAAQYFLLLRRQAAALGSEPRPLVIMTPKSLLRHPLATSAVEDLSGGAFQRVIDDDQARVRPLAVSRLILCSGKIAIDLLASPARQDAGHVAIVRVEELYPFPRLEIEDILAQYSNLEEIIWAQEEPRNMGAWRYMAPRLRTLAGHDRPVAYIGRPRRASPAEGSSDSHGVEQRRIINDSFVGLPEPSLVEEHGVHHVG